MSEMGRLENIFIFTNIQGHERDSETMLVSMTSFIDYYKGLWSSSLKYELCCNQIFRLCLIVVSVCLYVFTCINRERSGSVVECLTRDRRAAGLSITGVTALWSLSKTHLS